MEIDVVGDHEVHKPVAIIVAKSRTGRPAAIGHASLGGHVAKGAVAIISIKDVAAEAGDVDVWPAVIVVVAYRAAHGKAGLRQAGFCGDIGKRAVMIIVVQGALAGLPLNRHSY